MDAKAGNYWTVFEINRSLGGSSDTDKLILTLKPVFRKPTKYEEKQGEFKQPY
jgi:hypothetical protein